MKNFKENALMQEMNVNEMQEMNGGIFLVLVCCALVGVTVNMCSNNEVNIGHGTGNHIAVGDSIQNH